MRVSGLMRAEAAEVFEDFRVEDGGADFVDSGGPLAEVDFAAAVAAEGEVLVVEADEHATGGAAEKFCGFFLCGHRRCSWLGAVVQFYVTALGEMVAAAAESPVGWSNSRGG